MTTQEVATTFQDSVLIVLLKGCFWEKKTTQRAGYREYKSEFSTASELWLEPEARVFGYVIVSMVSLPNYMNRSLISWPWDIPMHKYLLYVCLHEKSLYQKQLFCEDENTLIVCHKVL